MANRSIKNPRCIVEDNLVKADKFIFPVDFIIFDMEENNDVSFIFGHPFLVADTTLIDVENWVEYLWHKRDRFISLHAQDFNKKGLQAFCRASAQIKPDYIGGGDK